jgi:hypothetical protein
MLAGVVPVIWWVEAPQDSRKKVNCGELHLQFLICGFQVASSRLYFPYNAYLSNKTLAKIVVLLIYYYHDSF